MSDKMSPRGRKETVSNDDVIEVALSISDPCFGTQEGAESLSIGNERTRQRLNGLVESGPMDSKKIGGSTVYWFCGH